jgi:flagellar motor switch protein FliN
MKTEQIGKVSVELSVVLGKTLVSLDSLAGLAEGSIIELDKLAGEPVDILASGEPVAYGEVVVIDENFGVRVTKMVDETKLQKE